MNKKCPEKEISLSRHQGGNLKFTYNGLNESNKNISFILMRATTKIDNVSE